MFAELFIISLCALTGIIMIDKYGTALGIFVCGILTYILATVWLRGVSEYANVVYDQNRNCFSRFLIISGNFYQQLICIIPVSNFTLKIKKLLGYCRILTICERYNESPSAETITSGNRRHCGTSPSLDVELKILIDQILDTYVKSWYCKFGTNNDFIRVINNTLEDTLQTIGSATSLIDKKLVMYHSAELYLRFISHLVEALEKVPCNVENTYEKCLALKKEIGDNFQMEHWAMKDEVTEWCYLQSFAGILSDTFGPTVLMGNPLLHNVIVEALTQNLICPLVDSLSNPDMLNLWLLKFMKGYAKENNYMSCYNFIANAESPLFVPPEATEKVVKSDGTPIISVTAHPRLSDNSETMQHNLSMKCNSSSMFLLNVSEASSVESFIESDTDKTSANVSQLSLRNNNSFSNGTSGNYLDASFHPYPSILPKARSYVNLSTADFKAVTVRKHSRSAPVEPLNIKRSKSADYIREVTNVSALLPLNVKNHSIRIRGKNNKTFVKLRSRSNFFVDVETAQEAIETEVPHLFTDVKIINTELQVEPGHTPYTLYCIQYQGVFHNVASAASVPDLVRQLVNVKRRFREFVALHSRLDDNPDIRGSLKGIKGPNKWLTSPFTNLDKKNVADRKIFLEHYLQDLCSKDAIANSSVLQEFLAYGGDASLAFVKSSPDINVPRIDKMIYRGMKGAIDLLKIALPNSPLEAVPFCEMDSEVFESFRDEESSAEYKFKEYLIAFTKNDPGVLDGIAKYFKKYELDVLSESMVDTDSNSLESKTLENVSSASSKKQIVSEPLSIDQPITVNDGKDSCSTENLLTDTLVDVGVALLRSLPRIFKTNRLVFFYKSFLGLFINRYIDEKIDEIWNKESCASIIHILHKAVWPEPNSPKKKIEDPIDQAKLLNGAVRKIIEAEYGIVSSLVLRTNPYASNALDLLLASFQNPKLNKCLIFHMLDVIAHSVCAANVKK